MLQYRRLSLTISPSWSTYTTTVLRTACVQRCTTGILLTPRSSSASVSLYRKKNARLVQAVLQEPSNGCSSSCKSRCECECRLLYRSVYFSSFRLHFGFSQASMAEPRESEKRRSCSSKGRYLRGDGSTVGYSRIDIVVRCDHEQLAKHKSLPPKMRCKETSSPQTRTNKDSKSPTIEAQMHIKDFDQVLNGDEHHASREWEEMEEELVDLRQTNEVNRCLFRVSLTSQSFFVLLFYWPLKLSPFSSPPPQMDSADLGEKGAQTGAARTNKGRENRPHVEKNGNCRFDMSALESAAGPFHFFPTPSLHGYCNRTFTIVDWKIHLYIYKHVHAPWMNR